jgi:hypothetical protein
MTGLFLIAVLAIWIVVLRWFVRKLAAFLPERPWRKFVQLGVFVVLMPLPLVDEIVAKPYFDSLCRKNAILVLDKASTQPRIVWFDSGDRTDVAIGPLNGSMYRKQYVEKETSNLVYHYSTLTVTGGWLIRALKISEGNAPLMFRSHCAPSEIPNLQAWLRDRLLTEIPRPISK